MQKFILLRQLNGSAILLKSIAAGLLFLLFLSCHEEEPNRVYISDYPDNKKAAISFTFDDGCHSVFDKIVPIFDEFGYKATFFIIASVVSDENWEKWKDLRARGYEIGNHSMTHRDLTELDSLQQTVEVVDSKALIESKLGGRAITSFAPPRHHTNEDIEALILQYHAFSRAHPGFCHWSGWTSDTREDFFHDDIKEAIKKGTWFVPAAHGISDGWEPITESLLRESLEFVMEHNDEIAVETFENIGKYRVEKNYTRLDITDEPNRKVITLRSELKTDVYDYPLTVIIADYDFPSTFTLTTLSGGPVTFIESGDNLIIKAFPHSSFEITW